VACLGLEEILDLGGHRDLGGSRRQALPCAAELIQGLLVIPVRQVTEDLRGNLGVVDL
jgi:hypothetical protein